MKSTFRNILLAEDNEDDAFFTKRALESAGIEHPIYHCRDGQDVIDYLGALASPTGTQDLMWPELILLDLKMPRIGGLEALSWIRKNDIFSTIIIFALTSSSEIRDVKAAYQLHINAYLVKPSSLQDMTLLAKAIRHFWLDQPYLTKPQISLP